MSREERFLFWLNRNRQAIEEVHGSHCIQSASEGDGSE